MTYLSALPFKGFKKKRMTKNPLNVINFHIHLIASYFMLARNGRKKLYSMINDICKLLQKYLPNSQLYPDLQ